MLAVDTFAIFPWVEVPLCQRVDWDRPAVKYVKPHMVAADLFNDKDPALFCDIETVVLERRWLRQPRPLCPHYEWAVYVENDAALERYVRLLGPVGNAVQFVHWLCNMGSRMPALK